MKDVYLVKTDEERFNMKRSWRVVAYRVTDERGEDVVQPWFKWKKDARRFCKKMGWNLIEVTK
jgi:hypothetical protein